MTFVRELMDPEYAKRTSRGSSFALVSSVDLSKITMMCWADPFYPDYSLPEHIKEATIKSLENNGAHYTVPIGDKELRNEIAKRVRRINGLNVDPGKNITVCGGSDTAFIFSMRPFLVPGEFNEVLIPTPSYANNFGIPPLAGGVTVTVPTFVEDDYDLRIEEFEKRLTSKTKVVLITNPNNPTTTVYKYESLKKLADFVEKNNLILIVDQCFEDTVFDGYKMTNIASMEGMFERTILLSSLSKGMGLCGFRIGYIVASEDISDVLHSCTVHYLGAPNTAAQAGAVAGLKNPLFIEDYRQEYMARADIICNILNTIPNIKFMKPQSGFFIWIDVSKYGGSEETKKYLIEKAAVMPSGGTAFGDKEFIRLIYAALKDRDACIDAVMRIKEALLEHPINK